MIWNWQKAGGGMTTPQRCDVCWRKMDRWFVPEGTCSTVEEMRPLEEICQREFRVCVHHLLVCENCKGDSVDQMVLSYQGLMSREEALFLLNPNCLKAPDGRPYEILDETDTHYISRASRHIQIIVDKQRNEIVYEGEYDLISSMWRKIRKGLHKLDNWEQLK